MPKQQVENTYVLSPAVADFFPARPAQEIMLKALAEGLNQGHLLDVRAARQASEPYNAELTKPIADTIRDRLKGALPLRHPFPPVPPPPRLPPATPSTPRRAHPR